MQKFDSYHSSQPSQGHHEKLENFIKIFFEKSLGPDILRIQVSSGKVKVYIILSFIIIIKINIIIKTNWNLEMVNSSSKI